MIRRRQQHGAPGSIRSRSGCATCKLRRVKCDEARPACKRCLKAGRICDYSVIRGFVQVEAALAKVPGTPPERRGFDFFHKSTTITFSGFFAGDFWKRVIVQAGFETSCLRHALVAVSALHERFMAGLPMRPRTATDDGYIFALGQYNKSIQKLNTLMSTDGCSSEVALMCCMLYICFDSFRGVTNGALMHLQNGIRIYHESSQTESGRRNQVFYDDVRKTLLRVGCQINSDMHDVSETHGSARDSMASMAGAFKSLYQLERPVVVTRFASLDDARHHLWCFINAHLYYYYAAHPYHDYGRNSKVPDHLVQLRQPILDSLCSWGIAFENLWKENANTWTPADFRAASSLHLHFKIQYIVITTRMLPDAKGLTGLQNEELYDQWKSDFEDSLHIVEGLIDSKPEQGIEHHSTFYPEIGVIPPLFFIAMKCRDPLVRSRAMSLLSKTHRREGTWDSRICLKIIQAVISAEEAVGASMLGSSFDGRVSATVLKMGDCDLEDTIEVELRHKDSSRYYVDAKAISRCVSVAVSEVGEEPLLTPPSTVSTLSTPGTSEEGVVEELGSWGFDEF